MDNLTTEPRAAREIVKMMGYKSLFEYIPEMEISVPDTDRKNSLDKIAYYYRSEEIVLSDLYIGYAISLYRYTIPKVVADTMQALGNLWPQKNVPKYISREDLLSRIKKMCSMGMLRRFVYQHGGNNIVLYSVTAEFAKIIYQALKLNTDARYEKDMIPPVEIVEKAAASLISSELMKSPNLSKFNFMPEYRDDAGRITFNARIHHILNGEEFVTLVEPLFTRVDLKRFTELEWEKYLKRKIKALKGYMEFLSCEKKKKVQLIIVCEDTEDFKKAATLVCTYFQEYMLPQIYFSGEGALKSGSNNINNSVVWITSVRQDETHQGMKIPGSVSSQFAYEFF